MMYMMRINASTADYIVIPFTPDNNMIPEKLSELIEKTKEGYEYVVFLDKRSQKFR